MYNSAEIGICGNEEHLAAGHTFRREAGFPYYTLGCLIEGEVFTDYPSCRVHSKAVSFSLTPPGLPYQLVVPGAHRELWLVFRARPKWLPWLNWGWAAVEPGSNPRLQLDDRSAEDHLLRALRDTVQYLKSPLSTRLLLAEAALEQALILACTFAREPEGMDPRLKKVLSRMNGELARPWREEELAQSVDLSSSHFAHLFRDLMGEPPMRYLEGLRMERAKALLLSTAMPVKVIAAEVGYPDALHFSARFRRVTGCSPSAFRLSGSGCLVDDGAPGY